MPPELPRTEIIHEFFEAARDCSEDGTALKVIEDISEELHVLPARVEVVPHVRHNYARSTCEAGVHIAPAPAKLLPKSNASDILLA